MCALHESSSWFNVYLFTHNFLCTHTNAHTPRLAMAFSAELSGKQKWCLKAEYQTSLYFMENQKFRVLPSAACG